MKQEKTKKEERKNKVEKTLFLIVRKLLTFCKSDYSGCFNVNVVIKCEA